MRLRSFVVVGFGFVVGCSGATGPRGPAGPDGPAGAAGAQGTEGSQGPAGDTGAQGPAGGAGVAGAPGMPGVGLDDLFGTGADGDVTLAADTTLTRDEYYASLTLGDGVTVDPNGYRIFVRGALTLGDNAAIRRDGGTATAGASSVMPAGTLGSGGAGQTDSPCDPSGGNVTNSLGGNAGSAFSATYGTATAPSATVGGAQIFDSVTSAITGRTLDGIEVAGGAGGQACGPLQYNGGGGGVIVVVAHSIVLSGAGAAISAKGGDASGMFDGGSVVAVGGGGGVIVVVSTSQPPAGLTLSVAGGNSVSPGTAGADGNMYWLD